jgi:Grx4 family monothiol glutaredoxin
MATNNIQAFTDTSNPIPEGHKVVVLFYADWHEACQLGGPMHQVLTALSNSSASSSATPTTETVVFGRCNVDENPVLTNRFSITSIPTFCLINGSSNSNDVTRIVGGDDIAAITTAVQRLQRSTGTTSSSGNNNSISIDQGFAVIDETTRLNQRLQNLIRSADVMIFMKGTPAQPRCGFSRQVIEIFTKEQIPIATFDILTDEDVRQGLKVFSNWPTYPQIYVHGELIGGLDILKEMLEDGSSSLAEQLGVTHKAAVITPKENESSNESSNANDDLNERLKKLTHRSHVMLFMKGLPSMPKCGFSRQIVEILEELNISYDAFDIFSDETIRQGLKVYSDWPTFPQLYVNGELIGGLDIVKEMKDDGSLQDALTI